MGEFKITHSGCGSIEQITVPNILHNEGADYLLRRMFPVGGSFNTRRDNWLIGLGGSTCLATSSTPNGRMYNLGFLAPPTPLTREAGYWDVADFYWNEGGANDTFHAALLGYERQATTFSTSFLGRSGIVQSDEHKFVNILEWIDKGSWDADNPKPQHQPLPWDPNHGYPYRRPIWQSGTLNTTSDWDAILVQNPYRANSWSIGAVFIVSEEPTPILLCSGLFSHCLSIKPTSSLWVSYGGQLYPGKTVDGGWVTADFIDKFTQRGWTDVATAMPQDYRAILLSDAPESLDWSSTLATVNELPIGAGYGRVSLNGWTKGANDYDVVAQCAGWTCTAPVTWETANYVAVIARFDGTDTLCWFDPITPIALEENDNISFPNGVKFSLREDYGEFSN
jgi:hypothetical protein